MSHLHVYKFNDSVSRNSKVLSELEVENIVAQRSSKCSI